MAPKGRGKKRDVFEWVGVVVDIIQAVVFVAAMLGFLFWYVSKGGGLPAVMVGLAVAMVVVLVLLFCVVTLLVRRG